MMNKYLLAVLISLCASVCYGEERYVSNIKGCSNTGEGTEAQPWCTIQAAADNAKAGETVYIKAGNYPENVQFQKSGSQKFGYITFKNYNDDVVNLDPGSLEMQDISYLIVEGLHIKNSPKERPGIDIGGDGSYIQILNNEVTGCENSDAAALRVGGSMHHFIIHGNHVHHNNTGSQEGLRVNGPTHDFEITHNEVDHNTNIGIDIVGWSQYGKPYNGLISRNLTHHNSLSEPWSAGIYLDCPNNITVEFNTSWENIRGIEMGCEINGDESSGNIIRYNIVYSNSGSGLNVGGYQGGLVRDGLVYNNLFYKNGGTEIAFDANPGINNRFYNNILYDPGKDLVTGEGDGNIFEYNNYVGNVGPGRFSITDDPQFENPDDHNFELKKGSPCIDAGDPGTKPHMDFKGRKTPIDGDGNGTAIVDIGPLEFGGDDPIPSPPQNLIVVDGIEN